MNVKFNDLIEALNHSVNKSNNNDSNYIFLENGIDESQKLTFKEMDLRARSIALYLYKKYKPEERALLLFEPGLDFISSFFACIYAGIIAVPAYPPDPFNLERSNKRLKSIFNDSKPSIILTSSTGITFINKKNYPYLHDIEIVDINSIDNTKDSHFESIKVNPQSIAYLQYTSGSTSTPKGVMISHENTIANLKAGQYFNGFDNNSIVVGWLPLYHDLGLIAYVLGTAYHSCKCILMPPFRFVQNPFNWLNAISKYRATHNACPPFGYELCTKRITDNQVKSLDLSSWKVAGIGADIVRKETIDRFCKKFGNAGFKREAFYPTYGMAECVLYASGGKRKDNTKTNHPVFKYFKKNSLEKGLAVETNDLNEKSVCLTGCGSHAPEHEIIIIQQDGTYCAEGEIGEICISGPSVSKGYFNRGNESNVTFYKSNNNKLYLKSGDIGFINEGILFISSRLKDLIIIKGKNYYPSDIEKTVENSHEYLRKGCGAVFSICIEDSDDNIIAAYEINEEKSQRAYYIDIYNNINKKVYSEHEIAIFAILLLSKGSIPKTSSGKVQRQKCKELFIDGKLKIIDKWNRDIYENENLDKIKTKTSLNDDIKITYKIKIKEWLTNNIAQMLEIETSEIDHFTPIIEYGITSNNIAELSTKFEDWANIKVDEIFTMEADETIEELTNYIVDNIIYKK